MINNLKNKKKKKGFTLIELIIVIAIIVILAAFAIPKFSAVKRSANLKADIADAKTIANATSALLSEGSITASTTAINLNASTESAEATKIKNYLQNVPVPKGLSSNSFIIKTTGGDVKVFVSTETTDTSLTDANQVYPEPTTKTNNIWYGGTAAVTEGK